MATFLELCQKVAQLSGTVTGTQPTTVADQTGRLAKIVVWTAQAWRDIQNEKSGWRWMRAEWEDKALTSGAPRYTAASFSIDSRFAEWIVDSEHEREIVTIYDNTIGVSDESPLGLIPWNLWRRKYGRGEQDESRPTEYAISPANEICFGPVPNSSDYRVSGEYRKSPQALEDDADEPEMPERFHDLIVWRALVLLGQHDEGEFALATAERNYMTLLDDLMRDQLPPLVAAAGSPLSSAGPLA